MCPRSLLPVALLLTALPWSPLAAQQSGGTAGSPPAAAKSPTVAAPTPGPGPSAPAAAKGLPTATGADAKKADTKKSEPAAKGKAVEKLKTPISGSGRRGETLADCMKYWDKGTHMTKAEWRATCVRQLANEKKARAAVDRQAAASKAVDARKAKAATKKQ